MVWKRKEWYGMVWKRMEWNGMECMGGIMSEIAKQKYVLKNYPQLGQSLVLLPSSILARQNNWLVQPQM
jgi:hypothetical protein